MHSGFISSGWLDTRALDQCGCALAIHIIRRINPLLVIEVVQPLAVHVPVVEQLPLDQLVGWLAGSRVGPLHRIVGVVTINCVLQVANKNRVERMETIYVCSSQREWTTSLVGHWPCEPAKTEFN